MIDDMVLMSEGDFSVKDVNWEKPDYKTLSKQLYASKKCLQLKSSFVDILKAQ